MSDELNHAVRRLEAERERKLAEVAEIDKVLAGLKGMVVILGGRHRPLVSSEYAGMGILEAARAFAKAAGKPLTTRDLGDGMTSNGWSTKSRNISATIYATLRNSKKDWKRNAQSEWEYIGTR